MRHVAPILLLLVALASLVALSPRWCGGGGAPQGPVRVRIDSSTRHQTIHGFGGFGAQDVYWSDGPFTSPEFVNRVVEDLGLTILRDEVPTSLEPVNDNDDPFDLDLGRFNLDRDIKGHHRPLRTRLAYLAAMKEAGVETFVASVWSPPAWMKHNRALDNGTDRNSAPPYDRSPDSSANQLRRDMYDEFAEWLVGYVRILQREVGIDLYAIGLQNEPRFSQRYVSCVYDGEALRDLVKVVGRRFEREGITTRIMVPEDTGWLEAIEGFVRPILDDPEARRHVDILAVHGYASDGVRSDSPSARRWRRMGAWGAPHGLPLWMTEASGFSDDWDGGLELAVAIYTALEHGNASAWLFWALSSSKSSRFSLIGGSGTAPSKRFYAAKQFYRWVRPGAVRTSAVADRGDLLPLSFWHPHDGTMTIVLINLGETVAYASIEGPQLPKGLAGSRSSREENAVDIGTVSLGSPVALPARSITTLHGSSGSRIP